MKLEISDWNMIPYAGAWSRQTEWFDALVHAKQAGEELKRKEREWRDDYNAKTVIEIERTERIRKRKGR